MFQELKNPSGERAPDDFRLATESTTLAEFRQAIAADFTRALNHGASIRLGALRTNQTSGYSHTRGRGS